MHGRKANDIRRPIPTGENMSQQNLTKAHGLAEETFSLAQELKNEKPENDYEAGLLRSMEYIARDNAARFGAMVIAQVAFNSEGPEEFSVRIVNGNRK
jgi:hypothetical protein